MIIIINILIITIIISIFIRFKKTNFLGKIKPKHFLF